MRRQRRQLPDPDHRNVEHTIAFACRRQSFSLPIKLGIWKRPATSRFCGSAPAPWSNQRNMRPSRRRQGDTVVLGSHGRDGRAGVPGRCPRSRKFGIRRIQEGGHFRSAVQGQSEGQGRRQDPGKHVESAFVLREERDSIPVRLLKKATPTSGISSGQATD